MSKPSRFPGPDAGDEPIQSAPTEPTPYQPPGEDAMTAAELEARVAELENLAVQNAGLNAEPNMTAKIAEGRVKSEQLTKDIVAAEAAAEIQNRLYTRARDAVRVLPANKKENALVQQAAQLRDAYWRGVHVKLGGGDAVIPSSDSGFCLARRVIF